MSRIIESHFSLLRMFKQSNIYTSFIGIRFIHFFFKLLCVSSHLSNVEKQRNCNSSHILAQNIPHLSTRTASFALLSSSWRLTWCISWAVRSMTSWTVLLRSRPSWSRHRYPLSSHRRCRTRSGENSGAALQLPPAIFKVNLHQKPDVWSIRTISISLRSTLSLQGK